MAIQISEVEVKYVYETEDLQELVLLGSNAWGQLVYASRGGDIMNNFGYHDTCSLESFAALCSKKIHKVYISRFNEIIELCNATDILFDDTDFSYPV